MTGPIVEGRLLNEHGEYPERLTGHEVRILRDALRLAVGDDPIFGNDDDTKDLLRKLERYEIAQTSDFTEGGDD